MDDIEITPGEVKLIVNTLNKLQLDIEGKKPIKPEIVLYYLSQISNINQNLSSTKEVIEKYNKEFSQQLIELIKSYDLKSNELVFVANKVTEEYSKIMDRIEKEQNHESQLKQTAIILQQSNDILQKSQDWEKLLDDRNKSTDEVTFLIQEIQNLSQNLVQKDQKIEEMISKYDEKIEKIIELQKQLIVERESIARRNAEIEMESKSIEEKETRLKSDLTDLAEERKKLERREQELGELQVNLVKVSKNTTTIFEEVKLAQAQMMETMTETTELLSEKTYLYKLEDDIKAKENDLKNDIAKHNREREVITRQLTKLSDMLDKTTNNLTLNEMTTEMLGNAVTQFNSQVKNISSLSDTMNMQIKNIHQEREEYQRVGNLINDQLDEINKQSDGMMKLNVLSTYIHQTILELRDAETSLKLLIDTVTSNSNRNQEATTKINKFLESAGRLFETTQQQIQMFALTNENLRISRNDLIDVQFQHKQKSLELDKVEAELENKERRLLSVQKEILDISMENKLASKNKK